jgi:SAM-dependent methyltransferase
MTMTTASGLEGYDRDVEAFFARAEQVAFSDKHAAVLHLFPSTPSRVLDIGAGAGRDTADFAAMGHRVLAVEPVLELRTRAMARHASPRITWLDDRLPDLSAVLARGEAFDLILLSAVWMHLDEDQRRRAMPNVARLLGDGGVMTLSLRHGPAPPEKRMFDVTAAETISLARTQGLQPVVNVARASIQAGNRLAGVTWTHLAFVRTQP